MRAAGRRDGRKRKRLTIRAAFEFFNETLFAGRLPAAVVMLHLTDCYRGYYAVGGLRIGEIALDPSAFVGRNDRDMLAVLVHEMTHHWQRHFGTPTRRKHHNREWAAKMEGLGLVPVPDYLGTKRRQGVTQVIVPDGPFARACQELLSGGVRLERRPTVELAGWTGTGQEQMNASRQ
jgi:hypothetical protein